jgi:glycosyltransferase involved in cell wall biosynthesis
MGTTKIAIIDLTYGGSHNISYIRCYAKACVALGLPTDVIVSSWIRPAVVKTLARTAARDLPVWSEKSFLAPYLAFKLWRKAEERCGLWRRPLRRTGKNWLPQGQTPTNPFAIWLLLFCLRVRGIIDKETLCVFLSAEQMLCRNTIAWRLIRPQRWVALLVGTSWLRNASAHQLEYASQLCIAHPSCRTVGTLTEKEADELRACLPTRTPVRRFPEPIELEVSCEPKADLTEAMQLVEGKKVALVTGILSKRKCVLELLRAWQHLSHDFHLILAGELHCQGQSQQEQDELATTLAGPDARFHVIDRWLDDDEINWLIRKSSFVIAIYRDFQGSSNVVAKAVAFRKPVVGLQDSEIGNRIHRHGVGRLAASLEPRAIAQAIESVATEPTTAAAFRAFEHEFGAADAVERLLADIIHV